MTRNKHDFGGNDQKRKESLKILGVIGLRGMPSVKELQSDRSLSGTYVYPLLKELCPEEDRVHDQPLFNWDDFVMNPEKAEEKFKKKVEKLLLDTHKQGQNFTVQWGSKEFPNGKKQAQLWVKEEKNWIKFEIEYDIVKDKGREKPVFLDYSFKVTRFNGAKERSVDYAFSLYRKSGRLYVYSTVYSNRDLRTCVTKTPDTSRIQAIHKIIKEQAHEPIIGIIKHNLRSIKHNLRIETGFDCDRIARCPIFHLFLCRSLNRHDYKGIVESGLERELENLKRKRRYWLLQINARGLLKLCATESEENINKVIKKQCSDPKYHYYKYSKRFRSEDGCRYIQALFEPFRNVNFRIEDEKGKVTREETMTVEQFWAIKKKEGWIVEENENANLEETKVSLKVDDLDFPFLLYHDEMIKAKILPENYVASELKQIAKMLKGLIDEVPLSELIFLVTDEYYRNFEYVMNIKPVFGRDSYIEEIKAKDGNLYDMIMNYQLTIQSYIESFRERKLQEERRKSNILNILLKEEPKPHGRLAMQFYFGMTADGRLAILEPKLIN